MPDVHDKTTRSRNMAAIRGKDTKPELAIRRGLHARGFRFRLHAPYLPGKPDLVMKKYQATVFVHGCFWHMHDCPRFKMPSGGNAGFWRGKLLRNSQRDREVADALLAIGWRRFVVWECALVGKGRKDLPMVVETVAKWLASEAETGDISGKFD
ncbi:very short patch repair endonuclease [Phaeobacter inhibens]|nr:very short patch repair endonuclease [Phaeobacter inhibens]UWR84121.1 very short patch repair endonuclease [Phaeobacter inhibens]